MAEQITSQDVNVMSVCDQQRPNATFNRGMDQKTNSLASHSPCRENPHIQNFLSMSSNQLVMDQWSLTF